MLDRVVIDWDTSDAEAFFDYAGYYARNMRTPLVRARTSLLHWINLTFQAEGSNIGPHWAPLSSGYRRWKEENYGERPLLVASGHLRSQAISTRAVHILAQSLLYELTVPYAGIHQDGGGGGVYEDSKRNQKLGLVGRSYEKPPARPFFDDSRALVEQVREHFVDWLEDLRGANRRRGQVPMPNPAMFA